MIWFFFLFLAVTYPKLSKFDGMEVYNFNVTTVTPTPTENQILWDDGTPILWDDGTSMLWSE